MEQWVVVTIIIVGYLALTPNLKGLERALSTGVLGKVAVFTAACAMRARRSW